MFEEGQIKNEKSFENVNFKTEITTILTLLDAKVLEKPLQLNGIRLLRKIIEAENAGTESPAADWDADDFDQIRKKIQQ